MKISAINQKFDKNENFYQKSKFYWEWKFRLKIEVLRKMTILVKSRNFLVFLLFFFYLEFLSKLSLRNYYNKLLLQFQFLTEIFIFLPKISSKVMQKCLTKIVIKC